ncbi:uncharacterized protein LOC132745457 [Ruditapes philippinarum]|uniref:uncharacterized protein LOC132745457 n=1 Tax=Ruditapes philippinarum TaxID=129788 RepID=UPI00295A693C|nr:uncharacterized protein LOC132745457 [Ruditapes philippinarum]
MQDTYWNKQSHESLKEYLSFHFKKRDKDRLYAQITTHSSLLTAAYKHTLRDATGMHPSRILILEALQSFDTEQQFISKIKDHILRSQNDEPVLIVVQCDSGDKNTNLIACAKYAVINECTKLIYKAPVSIIFIVQLTPMENKNFYSIQCGDWHSVHIDNLLTPGIAMPSINDMQRNRMSVLIAKSIESRNNFSLDQNETPHEQDKCLNLRLLIERSLQRALSLVRDPEENKHRSTQRVSLILLILHDRSNKGIVFRHK